MKKLILEMDKDLIENAEEVLDEMGFDILSAINFSGWCTYLTPNSYMPNTPC